MSPELINAIKERLHAGQTREEVETAVLAMGHQKEVFNAAFTLAEHDLQNKTKAELLRARTLFSNAWEFAQSRLDLVALLFIPLVLETMGSFWFEKLPESERFVNPPFFVLFLVIAATYIVTIAIALRVVAARDESEKTLPVAFAWMTKNALPLLWLYVLSGLLILGGLLFFIIPGLIVAISVTFAQYVFVEEDKRGMQALLASHALVKGRWWKVIRKVFGFVILTLIPLILFGILYGIIATFVGDGMYVTLGGELVTQAVSAVLSLMSIHAMYHLHKALRQSKGDEVISSAHAGTRYWALIALSVTFIIALTAAAIFFKDKLEWLEEAASVPIEDIEAREVPAAFSGFAQAALQFANEHEGSYAGVCEKLRPLAEADGEVTCNDSATTWALEVVDSSEKRFCSDTATPGKQIYAPIGDKTACISVGE